MRNRSEPWDRTCPDCNITFPSVQATGVCPSCGLIFDVDPSGELTRKGRCIGDPVPTPPTPLESATRTVAKYSRLLASGKITADEFQYNVLLQFAHMPQELWEDAADAMPDDVAFDFRSYVDRFLLSVDFMPSPTPFMVDTRSNAAIDEKKQELRPKYIALQEFWQSRG